MPDEPDQEDGGEDLEDLPGLALAVDITMAVATVAPLPPLVAKTAVLSATALAIVVVGSGASWGGVGRNGNFGIDLSILGIIVVLGQERGRRHDGC